MRPHEARLTCTACRQLLGEPDLVDGVYYFVCGACGTVEKFSSKRTTPTCQPSSAASRRRYQVTLPDSYKQFVSDDSRVQQHYEAPIEGPVPTTLAYFIENNTVSIGGFYSPDPLRPMSLFSSGYLSARSGNSERPGPDLRRWPLVDSAGLPKHTRPIRPWSSSSQILANMC